jgi:sugar (pentulose or hexulose) kinase
LYENPYDELRKAIEGSPIGGNNLIFLPHMVGAACPQWDPKSKGAFVGLTLDTSIGDLGRAIIEGSSMEISQGFRIVKDLGIDIKEIRLSGGACVKGSPWNQIQADVYGIPVAVTSDMDTTSIGCAILSAKACGMYKSLEDASDCMVRIIERIEPIDTNHNRYIKLSDIQNDVYEGLKSKKIFDRLFDEI